MRRKLVVIAAILSLLLGTLAPLAQADHTNAYYAEVPAGTRFLVELRDTLNAKKVKAGKKFDARTLEALEATDGSVIPAGAKIRGRVTHAEKNKLLLRFERIETGHDKVPLIATVVGATGEKRIKTTDEGEIRAKGHRGRNAAIGAAVGGGTGAAVGAIKGGKEAAIGAGIGAAAGAIVGAATGGAELKLEKGTRLELELDRPLSFRPRR